MAHYSHLFFKELKLIWRKSQKSDSSKTTLLGTPLKSRVIHFLPLQKPPCKTGDDFCLLQSSFSIMSHFLDFTGVPGF